MFTENRDHVGQNFGLQAVWKRLVAGRSLEKEGTHTSTHASSLNQSAPAWSLIDGRREKKKGRRTSLDDGRLI